MSRGAYDQPMLGPANMYPPPQPPPKLPLLDPPPPCTPPPAPLPPGGATPRVLGCQLPPPPHPRGLQARFSCQRCRPQDSMGTEGA